MQRITIALLLVILLCSVCNAASQAPEMRVLWVERWSITSPERCEKIVTTAKQCNFNCIVVQVRGRGDAFYNSSLEPRAQNLDGQPADFDPLALILKQAKKDGIQVHAWLNANYIWGSNTMPVSPKHIANAHPNWLMRNKNNEVVFPYTDTYDGCFTCPSHRAFRNHLRDVCVDLVKNYDVDGIMFDFIRYPDSNFCYCDWCLTCFAAEMNAKITPDQKAALKASTDRLAYVNAYPKEWNNFRCQGITDQLYNIYDSVKAIKPEVAVSASVFPNPVTSASERMQDWKKWLADGKIDILYPMSYFKTTDTFVKYTKDALACSNGVPVCPNIGSYLITADSTIEKIIKTRELGAAGAGVYCWTITKDGTDTSYLEEIRNKLYTTPVAMP